MRNISQDELKEIIARHALWLSGDGGERANLHSADLSYANLSSADLRYANLRYANLRSADLSYANLSSADLRYADLSYANLSSAVGGNSRIQCLQIDPYKIIILDKKTVWGGCTKKTAVQWLRYSGKELSDRDRHYLETVTKPFIRMVMEMPE